MINASISPQDRRVLLRKTPAKAMFWSHSRLSNVLQSIVLLLKFRANMYCFAALIYIDELVKASVGKTHRFQAYNSVYSDVNLRQYRTMLCKNLDAFFFVFASVASWDVRDVCYCYFLAFYIGDCRLNVAFMPMFTVKFCLFTHGSVSVVST